MTTTTLARGGAAAPGALRRDVSMAVLGAAAFGAAAGSGHGALAMAKGAGLGPTLFVGGALLSAPPLYLIAALGGRGLAASRLAEGHARALGAVGSVLLGLSVPAAFFSTTLHTTLATPLLIAACAAAGAGGVIAVAHHASRSGSKTGALATVLWCALAFALGARLIATLGRGAGMWGG